MDELDTTATQRITRSYPTSLGDIRDDLKKQILLNHTGSRLSYNQIPLVHGRSVGARLESNASAATNGAAVCGTTNKGTGRTAAGGRTRMANHQRNLSLDFRSMGIVLPPVSQVTNTRVNLTQHHRNRSLDSALQGIPEVEVSSPSAELEKTICTNSLYGAAMCSKISTSLYNNNKPNQKNLIECNSGADNDDGGDVAADGETDTQGSSSSVEGPTPASVAAAKTTTTNNEFGGWSDSDNLSQQKQPEMMLMMTTSPTAALTKASDHCSTIAVPNKTSTSSSSSLLLLKKTKKVLDVSGKKNRDDLTCLGSDDSGIICNSDHEHAVVSTQVANKMVSRDSISSTGDDMIEETEDEMFSHDGVMSRTPSEEDDEEEEQFTNSYGNGPKRPVSLVSSNGSNSGSSSCSNNAKDAMEITQIHSSDEAFPVIPVNGQLLVQTMPNGIKSSSSSLVGLTNKHDPHEVTSPTIAAGKDHKNDVMFKNFFGATKNAIFRTAQSIIENHEKKSSSKKLSIDLLPGEFVEDAAGQSPGAGTISTTGTPTPTNSGTSLNTPLSPVSSSSSPTTETMPMVVVAAPPKKREFFMLKPKMPVFHLSGQNKATIQESAKNEGGKKLPGSVQKYVMIKEQREEDTAPVPVSTKSLKCSSSGSSNNYNNHTTSAGRPTKADHNGLLRFFESPIFNIHFAVHYLFYSKEPGVLMFIANRIFSFPDDEVDLYIPQVVLMYTQMDELAEILDSYLVYRCRKSVDFSLKCAWLLESYNLNVLEGSVKHASLANKVSRLYLLKELYPKRERKFHQPLHAGMDRMLHQGPDVQSPGKKTHHRSQSDATGLLGGGVVNGNNSTASGGGASSLVISNNSSSSSGGNMSMGMRFTGAYPPKPLALGDLTTGRAFDNGCLCFVTVRGTVNDLRGQRTVCSCNAPKLLPEREFMKILIEIGRTLTSLPTKSEKTTALRMFLNLINKNLPARVWLPLHSEIPHHVVRITEDKTAILNSKDKTPYIIYVEVVEVNDIYTSPVMSKLMPTLRHTKSEEHLEGAGGAAAGKEQPQPQQQEAVKVVPSSLFLKPEEAVEDQEKLSNRSGSEHGFDLRVREDDVWSQEDDEITAQYIQMQKLVDRDAVSQLSMDSCDSKDQGAPVLFNIRDVRNRHCVNLNVENTKTFSNDPEDPSAAALKEPWDDKEKQIRMSSPYGHLPNWKLLSAIVKSGDDLRQELMATQLLQMFRLIWEEESVGLWVRPYKIVCLSNDSGLIEPILNTVSIHQIKKNSNKSLKEYFVDEYGDVNGDRFQEAQRKFMQSCAAYCLISYLLQVKDRHNGNILLHADGHLIHIDFGFILNISPKNLGFEQSPFKLTPEFVDVMGGPTSELWTEFKQLLLKGLLAARKHMERIINIVEIMRSSSQLPCFKNGCSATVRNLRNRFHMGLTEQELERKVEQLIQDSLNSLSTKLYDGYQYYTNGIL